MLIIYDMFYKMYFSLKRFCKKKGNNGILKVVRKFYEWYGYYFELFLNRKLAPWLEKHPARRSLNTRRRKERYIVSLTSFPVRINHAHIAVETLMRQSFKPDGIVLWLAESQFPEKKLPDRLTQLESRGLTIRWCDDLRSHKKYFYAFQEYPESNIILADDDLFYPSDTVKKLARLHRKHPKDIVCVSAQIIEPTLDTLPSVWPAPKLKKRYISGFHIQAFTGAGSLFPAGWYTDELFNKEAIMSMAETADDLWLKAMSIIAGIKTTMAYPARGFPVEIAIEHNQTLFQENGFHGGNANDRVWQALVNKYGLDKLQREN